MEKRVELLAPAGDWDAFIAAIENGADAVYLGSKLFNARQFAGNFDAYQLKKALEYAHVRDARIYLAMNTLVSDGELQQAVELAGEAYLLGIDGIIVQDIGLAGLISELYPDLDMHASTQMTVYNLEGVRMLERLGFKRVVLARELSLEEIEYIAKNTGLEIEVFIHGALCISYSGQCLMSSIIGGRSGNRGKCAQPCRLPYTLQGGAAGKRGYLLSPKDLCSLAILDRVVQTGVKSLKIEGRMKSAEYVATVVSIYRRYLDRIIGNSRESLKVDSGDLKKLAKAFNRGGFSRGYLEGKTGSDMMSFEKPNNWGVYIGTVAGYDSGSGSVEIKLEDALRVGDGIELWTKDEDSPGAVVSEIKLAGRAVKSADAGQLAVVRGLYGRITRGTKVYKTSDRELNAAARETLSGKALKKVDVTASITIRDGKPLSVTVEDVDGNRASEGSSIYPEKALKKPLDEKRIEEQLQKTGGTPFQFKRIDIDMDEGLSVPVSGINHLRRAALDMLEEIRKNPYTRELPADIEEKKKNLLNFPGNRRQKNTEPKLSTFFYSPDESVNLDMLDADRLYLPLSFVTAGRNARKLYECREKGKEIFMWLPSVTRGNYDRMLGGGILQKTAGLVDGYLLGNAGSMGYTLELEGSKLVGDHSLNAYNSMTLKSFSRLGMKGITLSLELTLEQLGQLAAVENLEKEVVVYGRIPLMTSEYCPVGSIEGGFREGAECSGACGKGTYGLKDRMGMVFPVMCDRVDCRSTVFNSNRLLLIDSIGKIKTSGVDWLRLNFTDECGRDIERITSMHRMVLRGVKDAEEAFGDLMERLRREGFTKGHYFRGV